jgi:hypothetical protein
MPRDAGHAKPAPPPPLLLMLLALLLQLATLRPVFAADDATNDPKFCSTGADWNYVTTLAFDQIRNDPGNLVIGVCDVLFLRGVRAVLCVFVQVVLCPRYIPCCYLYTFLGPPSSTHTLAPVFSLKNTDKPAATVPLRRHARAQPPPGRARLARTAGGPRLSGMVRLPGGHRVFRMHLGHFKV